jgi:hypothetical protein
MLYNSDKGTLLARARVPRKRLGIPEQFRLDQATSRRCVRREGENYVFDFSGMAPLPSDDMERRAVVLLEQLEDIRRSHPEIFERLGIEVRVEFRDDLDDQTNDG